MKRVKYGEESGTRGSGRHEERVEGKDRERVETEKEGGRSEWKVGEKQ